MKERRIHKRYEVHKDVYVYRAERVGRICNISMGGLMCNCVHHSPCAPVNFDIFCPGSNVCLPDLPFRVIEAKNTIEFPSANDVWKYWSSHNMFNQEIETKFKKLISEYFEKNDKFLTTKVIKGVIATKEN